MSKVQNFVNLETLAGGAFAEKINDAIMKVAENIQDPNTAPTTSRAIEVKIRLTPNKTRSMVNTTVAVTTKLAPTETIETELVMGKNMRTGRIEVAEYDPNQGQVTFDDVMGATDESPTPDYSDEPAEVQDGKPLDLRNRGKKQESPSTALVDQETGEIIEEPEQSGNNGRLIYAHFPDHTAQA